MPTLNDNVKTTVIHGDDILFSNNDDKHNDHVNLRTTGNLGENDIHFLKCNVKILDGDLSTKNIKDLVGNNIITIGTNSIDFNNASVSNLSLGTGSLNADNVGSANGYASLDLELDAHLALINGKVAQNGHSVNKCFVSSNGGSLTTSSLCVAGDLAKIASGAAVDLNTAKTSFPGFGTTAGTALQGDTTTISPSQASAISSNTSNVSTNTSNISTNTANISSNDTDIAANTSSISTNTSNISTNISNISTNTSNISSNDMDIAANTSNISTNTTHISTNSTNISSNDTDIANNSSNISTNTSNISTNTGNISTNTTNILSNDTDIANNASAISTNTSNISTNTSNISTNISNISTNSTDITAVNAGRVANAAAIAVNAGNISTNTTNVTSAKSKTDYIIVTQAVNLDTMESGIATNTSNITSNDTDIANNTQSISNISSSLNSVNSDIADIETKTNKISVSNSVSLGVETHGNVTLFAGPVGATSYVSNKNGNLTLKGGYDGSHDSGEISLLTNNTERMIIDKDGHTTLNISPGNQFDVKRASLSGYNGIRLLNANGKYRNVIFINGSDAGYFQAYDSSDTAKVLLQAGGNSYLTGGRLGIGTTSPKAGLEVSTTAATNGNTTGIQDDSVGYISHSYTSSGEHVYNYDFNSNNYQVSIIGAGLVYAKLYVGASDIRIKKNIIEVNDDLALKKVRDISCCWYNYVDSLYSSSRRTIGFLAQQVKEHLPEAVQEMSDFIPNVMKLIHTSWNETKMSSSDLQDVSGIKYRFYVSNDISGNEKMVELVGDENNCFIFKEKWENVFCYGKEVDDFHTLDKQKLFALNFSATQELDKLVTNLIDRVNDLEALLAEKESN